MNLTWKRKSRSPEEKAALRKLRKWHLWSAVALFAIDLVRFGGLIGLLLLPVWPIPDAGVRERIIFAGIIFVISFYMPLTYFAWTWFTVGWRIVAPHSAVLYLIPNGND